MTKRMLIPTAVVVGLLVGGVTAYALGNNTTNNPIGSSVSSSKNKTTSNDTSKSGTLVTEVGTIECLTPNNAGGTQATSCAIGLRKDDGTNFAITSKDPTTTGSLPTGQRVQITGTLTQEQSTQYDIAGIIAVESVQRL